MKWYLLASILLLFTVWSLQAAEVKAQDHQVVVTTASGHPLLINGEEIALLPAIVGPGSQVCVTVTLPYIGEGERQVFQGWSHGPETECVFLTQPGEYTAQYASEVLLQIGSAVMEYRTSTWVAKGFPTLLSVPEMVEERPGVRYHFLGWTGGQTPFSAQNTIVPVGPTTLGVNWRKEYLIELEGPENVDLAGSGWYDAEKIAGLKAPATQLSAEKDERLQFSHWEVISNPPIIIPDRQNPLAQLRVDDTHRIKAVYNKSYLVVAKNPEKTIIDAWIQAGEEIAIETPLSIDVVPEQERQSFKEWEGTDIESANGFLVVDGPLNITALYETQFRVTVSAPHGASGGGWYTKGEVATIKVPENPSKFLIVKTVFDGFPEYPDSGPTLRVPVIGPLTVTASYRTDISLWIPNNVLGAIVIGFLVVIGLAYLVLRGIYDRLQANV